MMREGTSQHSKRLSTPRSALAHIGLDTDMHPSMTTEPAVKLPPVFSIDRTWFAVCDRRKWSGRHHAMHSLPAKNMRVSR